MPGPHVAVFYGDEKLPSKVDVVVVGGGIVGVSTALELTEQGLSVALCEKGGIAREQSSRNWGWVRLSARSAAEMPLMLESMRIWEGVSKRSGRDVGFRRMGSLMAGYSERELEAFESWRNSVSGLGVESRVVSAGEFRDRFPGLKIRVKGALYGPNDSCAEPEKGTVAFAETARDRGATILTNCAVRGFERTAGRISSVITERGRIDCGAAVVAGGAWSNMLCRRHGVDLPQLCMHASAFRTGPSDGPDVALWSRRFCLRKRQDGGYTIANGEAVTIDIVPNSIRYFGEFFPAFSKGWRGIKFRITRRSIQEVSWLKGWALDKPSPFEAVRVLDPAPVQKLIAAQLADLTDLWPSFANVKVIQKWAGYVDATPDLVPVISAVDGAPGLHVATGFSGHGFGMGPGGGRLMADIVSGRTPIVDPSPFRYSRFYDGTKIAPSALGLIPEKG